MLATVTTDPRWPSSPARLAQHLGDDVLGRQVGAGQVHRDDPRPLVGRQHVHRAAAGHARRVDQPVHRAAEVDGGAHERRHRGFVRHVDMGERPAADSSLPSGTSSGGTTRSAPMTRAPSSSSRAAVARPMPDAAPVTM